MHPSLKRASLSVPDSRFNNHVLTEHKKAVRSVQDWQQKQDHYIKASKGHYTIYVAPIRSYEQSHDEYRPLRRAGRFILVDDRLPSQPVPAGYWMDFPEDHWLISEENYYHLPVEQRAYLEASEQINKYVSKQFRPDWFAFYYAPQYGGIYWQDYNKNYNVNRKFDGCSY